ncbi:hypothetical protein [Streptomyces sp. TRM68367]|uniref:hypothetical protein n=1 Tax=Streptomyces sp. TRM68367 TaxID=2758415 RepID=UPI00165B664B|nr:hypothetical protein [Streptomyces sp. TRM68367]MBC9731195.1 hypothetical protein [Streptomyces sp. TRM68367]
MPHCIARVFEPLLRLLWPAPGRHRRPDHSSAGLAAEASTACPPRVPAARVLRGQEIGLVRPYLVAHEQREAQKRQARRRTLRLEVRGIDISPLLIHAGEVMA